MGRTLPRIANFRNTETLQVCIQQERTRWSSTPLPDSRIPAMTTAEERAYYCYIGQFYSGMGRLVELGPWLGSSTFYILNGLVGNPKFAGEHLHVFDDFIWRAEWMDPYVRDRGEELQNHEVFRFLFEKYVGPLSQHISVQQRRLCLYDGNDAVQDLAWDHGPVEFMYIDCGRTFEVNEAWYRIFSPYFLPNRTLLMMQDWGTHREIPSKPYNQTKQFVDSKGASLRLVHELRNGQLGTFLYRGNNPG